MNKSDKLLQNCTVKNTTTSYKGREMHLIHDTVTLPSPLHKSYHSVKPMGVQILNKTQQMDIVSERWLTLRRRRS